MSVRARRKGLIFSQCGDDYNLSKCVYYGYSPQMSLKLRVTKGEMVRKDEPLGTITIQQKQQEFLFPYAGRVVELGQMPEIKEGTNINLTILILEKCQHWPGPVPTEKGTDLCIHCGQVIWHHYEKTTVDFSFGDIQKQMDLSLFDSDAPTVHSNFEWLITKNEHITKNTQIAKLFGQPFKINITGKVKFIYNIELINAQFLANPESSRCQIIISIAKVVCRHEKVIGQTCQFCLQTIEQTPVVYLFQQTETGQARIGRALQLEQQQYMDRLNKQKKGILILDLDNTILHAISQVSIKEELQKYPEQLNEFLILPLEYPIQFEQQQKFPVMTRVLVKMRPYFELFLRTIVELYDIYVYTKGTRLYAEAVCRAIRQKYAQILEGTTHFKSFKMISRDQDPNIDKKSIKNILPTRFESVVILDDRRDIWESAYCIYVKEYFYFRLNNDQKSWRIDHKAKKDCYFIYVSKTLKKIHGLYFQKLAHRMKWNSKADERGKGIVYLNKIYHGLKKMLSEGMKAKFILDNIPDQQLDNHGLYRRARRIGLEKENQKPSIVVRSYKLDSSRINEIKRYSQQLKIPIVSQMWVSLCYQFNYHFPIEPFTLQNPLEELIDPKTLVFDQLLQQIAIKLL